ncbi:sensor histidine kinase [Streptomyces sp. AP-93]|uniref:sensor histidine kinase n=1 Tax=Streptomyces sp. AP-93 TaxID=2929048 RepID=UPI001FB01E09|nr:histidine kinase [Streptomyces sp. AP-93]MCJ0873904.1 histidine kinase [Streptomyces sp. AP-93]
MGAPVDLALAGLAALDVALALPTPQSWQTAVSFLAAPALLLRRRLPRLALLLTIPGLYAGAALFAAVLALGTLAHRRRFDWQVELAAVAVVTGSFLPWPVALVAETPRGELIHTLLYALLLGIGPTALGLLVQTRQDLSERIVELGEVRDHERELHARTVIAREHARLAREMHDVVSHQASLMAVQAGALEVTTRDPQVKAAAAILRKLATGTLEELRGMIVVLRAAGAGPTGLHPQPRLSDLPALVEGAGLDVGLRVTGAEDHGVPETVERAVYRTVQEALTNIRKHAPGAAASVTVDIDAETLRVTIRNSAPADGAPRPDLPGGGYGILGLRERAALLGGSLSAEPTADGGFSVCAEVPLSHPSRRGAVDKSRNPVPGATAAASGGAAGAGS